jgi:hypothetical protein
MLKYRPKLFPVEARERKSQVSHRSGRSISRVSQAESVLPKPDAQEQAAVTSVSGYVTEERSGLPLSGVQVKWFSTSKKRGRSQNAELGTAVTDSQGQFSIDAKAEATCARNGGEHASSSFLYLVDAGGKSVSEPVQVTGQTRDIILHPTAKAKVTKQQWKVMANFLTTNRMLLVSDLAQQIATPFADNPATNWSPSVRASALRAISAAAKPNGGTNLLEQNTFLELHALGEGNVRRGINYLADPRSVARQPLSPAKVFPWLPASDRQLYRDYLRGAWVTAAQKMYVDQEHIAAPAVALLERQLDERFEQDFHTGNDAVQPAVKLLIPLLRAILYRDSQRGGFGVNAGGIPAQGAQSDDDYLAALIALSKVSARELRNRFRVSFERAANETTSPLQLNIEALLGLLSDSYQSSIEPFIALPVVYGNGEPLIFGPYVGRAPFFLEYEEWLERQRPFYPENIYDIRKNLPYFSGDYRNTMEAVRVSGGGPAGFPGEGYFDDYSGERSKSGAWIEELFPVADKIRDACAKIDGQLYPDAIVALNDASATLEKIAQDYAANWIKDKFWWWWSWGKWNNENVSGRHYSDVWVGLIDRAKIRVTSPDELTNFEAFFDPPYYPVWTGNPGDFDYERAEKGLAKARTLYIYNIFYLYFVLLPYLRSQVDFAQGNFANAVHALSYFTGYRVGVAETNSAPGYDTAMQPLNWPNLYRKQTLPYTTLVGFNQEMTEYANLPPILSETWFDINLSGGRLAIAPFEQRFFKLAQGEVMLAWADQLYRNDDPSSIRRARELYKGVLFMHGDDPDIAPHFPRNGDRGFFLPLPDPIFWKYTDNPAKISQTTRAHQALYQIEAGLNVYGYRADMVPLLRYKPLKQAADLFATSAKSAQNDFLNYMTRYEQALIELWQTQSLVKKAQASAGIAQEHIAIAQAGVDKAQEQVAAVQAQITAKEKEIADKNSLFSQFSDYFSGVKDSLQGMVPLAKKVMADDGGAAGTVSGDEMLDIFSKGASGGTSASEEAAAATLGSGAAFMIGFGAFAYTSYTSMQSMADAANKRDADLKSLQTVALPAAQAQVRLKQRDVTIAQYESQIAQADLEFANMLLRFQQDRFLNADFWNKLTLFANRLMRRYVELGARAAWQAERALAFEQNRVISIIKLNYLPAALRGVTGADTLLADLAELEANRIQGVRLSTPVKHTVSLARNFPLAFGQLKKTGSCRFATNELDLRAAYPGTFAYRIRAITAAMHNPDGAAPRGILRNGGVSLVSDEDLTTNVLTRFADALALSEFRLQDDLFVYGLPGETLLQFEGSGFETAWELQFPIAANPAGFSAVADVLITFDCNAYYSDSVAAKQAAQPPQANRAILLAASNVDPLGLTSLKHPGTAKILFDPAKIALPVQEKTREVTNLALICVGTTTKKYKAKLSATKSGATASFNFQDGLAFSNSGVLLGGAAALPLNALTGIDLNQPFSLEIQTAGVSDELRQLFDVVLYLDYQSSY